MADLSIVIMKQCSSLSETTWKVKDYNIGCFRGEYSCDCPGFKFRKDCKHVREVKAGICGWHEQYSDEVLVDPDVCPKCGKQTESVRVGV